MRALLRLSCVQHRHISRERPLLRGSGAAATALIVSASTATTARTFSLSSSSGSFIPRISIAPMVDVTDVHFRVFVRLVSSTVHLYTEMVPAMKAISCPAALDAPMSLNPSQHHIQMGGCPSLAAQRGGYGAVTMCDPNYPLVLRSLSALSPLPLSVKCRIGVDEHHSYEFFSGVVRRLVECAGIAHVIVHCRRAVLGMSPHHNRCIPPLEYGYATRLKREWGDELRVEVNGGIASEADVRRWMADDSGVDGIMIGRWAQRQLWQCLQHIDEWTIQWRAMRGNSQQVQQSEAAVGRPSREAALSAYCAYIRTLDPTARGNHSSLLIRPIMSVWQGERGCSVWKKRLVEGSKVRGLAAGELIQWALDGVYEVRKGNVPAAEEENGEEEGTAGRSRLAYA